MNHFCVCQGIDLLLHSLPWDPAKMIHTHVENSFLIRFCTCKSCACRLSPEPHSPPSIVNVVSVAGSELHAQHQIAKFNLCKAGLCV